MASNPKSPTDQDLEAGATRRLYPSMTENPALRWAFIRKVYTILTVQLLITAAVATALAATVDYVPPVALFLFNSWAGLGVFISVIVLALAVLVALMFYRKKHPVNCVLMGLFTVLNGLSVGIVCAFTEEMILLEAFGTTVGIFIGLPLYTFWAARGGFDFNFLGLFLFAAVSLLLAFSLTQIVNPVGKTSHMIFGMVGCIIFCGFIVYDTDQLIKRHQYDEHILAAVQLYLDAINLFMGLITARVG